MFLPEFKIYQVLYSRYVHSIIAQPSVANWRCFCRRAGANILARAPVYSFLLRRSLIVCNLSGRPGRQQAPRSFSHSGSLPRRACVCVVLFSFFLSGLLNCKNRNKRPGKVSNAACDPRCLSLQITVFAASSGSEREFALLLFRSLARIRRRRRRVTLNIALFFCLLIKSNDKCFTGAACAALPEQKEYLDSIIVVPLVVALPLIKGKSHTAEIWCVCARVITASALFC